MAQLTTKLVAPTMTKSSSHKLPNPCSSSTLSKDRLRKKRYHCPGAWSDTTHSIPAHFGASVALLAFCSPRVEPCRDASLNA